jgi:hypothetical protein
LRARGRIAVAVAVSATLTASSVGGAPASSPDAPGPETGAEQSKKKKSTKKCRREKQSPLFNALSCTRLVRTIPHDPSIPSGNERYDFCRNSTYLYRKADYEFDGRYFITTYRGRWKVINSTSGSGGVSGAIQYTVNAYRSVFFDGTPAETQPGSLLSNSVAFDPFGVDFGGTTYLRGKTPC